MPSIVFLDLVGAVHRSIWRRDLGFFSRAWFRPSGRKHSKQSVTSSLFPRWKLPQMSTRFNTLQKHAHHHYSTTSSRETSHHRPFIILLFLAMKSHVGMLCLGSPKFCSVGDSVAVFWNWVSFAIAFGTPGSRPFSEAASTCKIRLSQRPWIRSVINAPNLMVLF